MVYRETFFYIDSEYNGMSSGWPNVETAKAFHQETRAMFQGAGWTLEPGEDGVCDTVRKGKQFLYLHPQHFSGPVQEGNIPEIENRIRKAKTFFYVGRKLYKTYREWTDEEYLAYLDTQKNAITDELLKRYKTANRNRYIIGGCTLDVADKFHVDRIDDPDRHHDLVYRYVSGVFDQLVAQGLLIKSPTGRSARAAFQYERKEIERQRKEGSHGG